MTYRISTVSDMTGIPRNTLLAWERRYGLVRPTRHDNGYRSYTEQDVATILRLKNAMAVGLRIGEAVDVLKSDAKKQSELRPELGAEGTIEFAQVRDELVGALTEYRRPHAEAILHRLFPVPFRLRLTEVFFPVLRRIGDLWSEGKISIAQEHYASAILRAHLAGLLITVGTDLPTAPHAVTTTFVGDNHEMAALALAIQLSTSGFRVSYLGPNLPASELVGFAKKFRPELVCISCILEPSVDELSAYMAELAEVSGTRWVLGGALPEIPTPLGVETLREWADFNP
jgi:MerR family transcriptional regulator, light-induced transcriptional regulator